MTDDPELTSTSASLDNGGTGFGGSGVGAYMSLQPVCPPGGRCCSGCCINVYVNSNVQGADSSVLSGSRVVVRDAGVRIYIIPRHGGGTGGGATVVAGASPGWEEEIIGGGRQALPGLLVGGLCGLSALLLVALFIYVPSLLCMCGCRPSWRRPPL